MVVFEIFRAIVIQMVNASIKAQEIRERSAVVFTPSDRETFLGVLKTIAKEYGDLTDLRNGLLHGSWFVGYDSSKDFDLHKSTVTKDGLVRKDLPKNTAQLFKRAPAAGMLAARSPRISAYPPEGLLLQTTPSAVSEKGLADAA